MFNKTLKKLFKCSLVFSILFTGVLSPVNIFANDTTTYANPITVKNKKFTNILSFGTLGNKGIVTLDVNMKLYTDSLTTTMRYSSVACTPGSNTSSCSVSLYSSSGYDYTALNDSAIMIKDFKITTVVNNKTYVTIYRFYYQNNDINTHSIVTGPTLQ